LQGILQLFERQDIKISDKLQTQLATFHGQFIPYLQGVGKDLQVTAEM
jgi:hypothetical protein